MQSPVFHHLKLLTLLVPAAWASFAYAADDDTFRQRRVERIARASWQPYRPVAAEEAEEISPQQQGVELMPMPAPGLSGETIIEGPIYHDPFVNSCDGIGASNLPGGGLGCDGTVGCDSMGGCDGGGNCNDVTCFPCRRGKRIHIELPCTGWFQIDALSWWQRGMNMPPLVTTSPNGTARAAAGVLGQANTTVLFGDTDDLLEDAEFGGRLRFGIGLGRTGRWAVGAELLDSGTYSASYSETSVGQPTLARPYFDIVNGQEASRIIAIQDPANGNTLSGVITTNVSSQLEGISVQFLRGIACGKACGPELFTCRNIPGFSRIAGVVGWRNLQLDESLAIAANVNDVNPARTFLINDQFDSDTTFNGLDLGFALHGKRGRWTMDLLFKTALGTNRQRVSIEGDTQINTGGVITNENAGLLALASNSGTYRRDRFAVVPELGMNLAYQMGPNWSLTTGYTFIYWSNVVRPGDQVDLDVNPNGIPPVAGAIAGANRPAFQFNETDYWTQGLNLGARFDW